MPQTPRIPAAARVFEERAGEYDRWFDNSLLFAIELAALQSVQALGRAPALELGVGPGRFASALGTNFGLDPALSALQLAKQRDIMSINGLGEALPLRTGCLGSIWLLFTLCFLKDPPVVLQECHRVLRPDGRLFLGFVPADSAWGRLLAEKGKAGHPFYRHATLLTSTAVQTLLETIGFQSVTVRSTLLQPPDHLEELEPSRPELIDGAGFCVLVAAKKETECAKATSSP